MRRQSNPPSVVVDDAEAVPAQFWTQPEPPAPRLDKAAVAKALKGGATIDGVHLEQSERLVIGV